MTDQAWFRELRIRFSGSDGNPDYTKIVNHINFAFAQAGFLWQESTPQRAMVYYHAMYALQAGHEKYEKAEREKAERENAQREKAEREKAEHAKPISETTKVQPTGMLLPTDPPLLHSYSARVDQGVEHCNAQNPCSASQQKQIIVPAIHNAAQHKQPGVAASHNAVQENHTALSVTRNASQQEQMAVSATCNATQQKPTAVSALAPNEQTDQTPAQRRADRKQHLLDQRALQPYPYLTKKHSTFKNDRGGAGIPAKCRLCGQPRLGTHGGTGCPFVDRPCDK